MMKKNKRWIFFSAVLLFVALVILVVLKKTTHIDTSFYQFVTHFQTPWLTSFFRVITEFGDVPLILLILLVILVVFRNYRFAYILPIHVGTCVLFNVILKELLKRPRPLFPHLVEVTGFSFPSGHAMATMTIYGYLFYVVYHYVKNQTLRNILCVSLCFLIFLVGLSRIYLGVHYLTDVLAGFSISICYLYMVTSLPIFALEERTCVLS